MVRFYGDAEVIFREGDRADNLIVLLHGHARVVAEGMFLVARGPGEIIGEQALISGGKRSATLVAQGAVKALVLPRAVVDKLMGNAAFLRAMLGEVSSKLAEVTKDRAFRYRNEQLLFSEFRAHLSPEITSQLLDTGKAYGEPRYIDAVILFSDIRSFTQRSAHMTPEEIARQLGPYLDAVVDLIHQHEGLVDKFVGDAVMGVWGFAPSEAELADQAFACAEDMVRTARQMRFGGEPIEIGVGLNAGQVFIGNLGGEGKRQFTVLGTAVNLASRYESESKVLGAPIVVGQTMYERLAPERRAHFIKHADREIKGAEPQTLYTCTPSGEA